MATMEEFRSPNLMERVIRQSRELFRMLDDLWRAVEPSVSNAKIVFPEYTPHDFTHLQRLFDLCENVLTEELLATLNVTECFLLSAAIIAHDWGMGVSSIEQQAIIAGKEGRIKLVGPDDDEMSIALLPDEQRRLQQHQLVQRVKFKWNNNSATLADPEQLDSWRDYLRNAHPERSAERIRLHLYRDNAIGQVIALISHGHGQEHSVIENAQQYSTHRLINGEFVNIQALTLYLRLIDLIDIGKGRTPYELWQYVNPGNQTSAKEWKKHRAMEEPRLDGGTMKFAALTRSGSILAELFNLKHYCESEFEWQKRLLRRSSLPQYEYVFQHMEWDIATEGNLHKTPVRFGFAREQLLHLLSEEIYDGDPYVFLRELVQNAIDAITTRQLCLQGTSTPLSLPLAAITIDASENNKIIKVRDVGSGMTSYIIEHYLALAGQSYYRSQDFTKLGLNFDPISRFGIGILSCFVVADRVIIQTRTDPECFVEASENASEAWRIEIPAGRGGLPLGYWEWTKIDPASVDVGTEVTVIIDPNKLGAQMSNLAQTDRTECLRLTDYLKTVASFVSLPIYINEVFGKTVILHPSSNVETVLDPSRSDYHIHQLGYRYDLAEHVNPLDLPVANEHIEIETIDLKSLNLPGIEGVLSYPKPKDTWRVVARQARELTLCNTDGSKIKIAGPRFTSGGDEGFMENFRAKGICKSAKTFKRCGVYFQGLLMADVSAPKELGPHGKFTSTLLSFPNLFLNFTKQINSEHRPGPSRRSLRDSSNTWASQIFAAHAHQLAQRSRDRLLSLNPLQRLGELFRILEQHFVSVEDFATGFEWDEWPIPVLLSGGRIEVRLLRELKPINPLVNAPHIIAEVASMHLFNKLGFSTGETVSLSRWNHELCVFGVHLPDSTQEVRQYSSNVLKNHFRSYHGEIALSSPSLKQGLLLPPFYPDWWKPAPSTNNSIWLNNSDVAVKVLQKGIEQPTSLSLIELSQTRAFAPTFLNFRRVTEHLPQVFATYPLWSASEINISHPIGETLCRIHCAYAKARFQQTISNINQAKLEKAFTGLPIQAYNQTQQRAPLNSLRRLNKFFATLKQTIESIASLNFPYIPEIKITADDLLPGAFNFVNRDEFICISLEGNPFEAKALFQNFQDRNFGEFLLPDSPWPPPSISRKSRSTGHWWDRFFR